MSLMQSMTVAVALAAIVAPRSTVREWKPSRAQVEAIEPKVAMPGGALGPLLSYERYYAGEMRHGRRFIVGELRRITTQPLPAPFLRVVPLGELRRYADFGCAVVTFEYDVAARRLSPARCNGDIGPPPPRP